MDPSSSTPVPAQTPPSAPQGYLGGPIFDPMQQNQNYGIAMDGVQTTTSFAQPQQPSQEKGQESTPNLCCCCELRVALGVMAAFEVVFQAISLIFFYLHASYELGDGMCFRAFGQFGKRTGRFENSLDCIRFNVAVLFFICLALMSSIVLLFSTCCMKKLSVVSHVVGWIPILAAVVYTSIYQSNYEYSYGFLVPILVCIPIGLLWRIHESFVVYNYWKEVPGQYASHKQANAHGRTNYDYATRGYGGYGAQPNYGNAQPGGYNYGGGGYGGFGQPGYGGYAGYGGFGQPVSGYNHV